MVLFGVVDDDSRETIQVKRQGVVLMGILVEGPAYIVRTENILLTDTTDFLDADGRVLVSTRPID